MSVAVIRLMISCIDQELVYYYCVITGSQHPALIWFSWTFNIFM